MVLSGILSLFFGVLLSSAIYSGCLVAVIRGATAFGCKFYSIVLRGLTTPWTPRLNSPLSSGEHGALC